MALAERSPRDARALEEYVSHFSDLLEAWKSVAPEPPRQPRPKRAVKVNGRDRKKSSGRESGETLP